MVGACGVLDILFQFVGDDTFVVEWYEDGQLWDVDNESCRCFFSSFHLVGFGAKFK